MLPERAVCVVCIGATIGKVCMTSRPSFTNQQINSVIVNEHEHDPFFVYHLMTTLRDELKSNAGGAATPIINKTTFSEIEIAAPPLHIQRRIAGVLSAYDELIENSQRRIKILESMARALYREWFVHFRFPGHESVPLVPSRLGDIPQGWQVKPVKDILCRRASGTVYCESEVKSEGSIQVVDQSTNELLGFHEKSPDHPASPTAPIAIFGDHTCKMQLLFVPFSVGPNVIPFEANNELPTIYVFYAVNCLVKTQEYKRHWTALNAKEIIVADSKNAQLFASLIQPILISQGTLREAIRNLRYTRDLLLPRLLSGQIDVEALPA
jgi:type I restriction enzyme S subunit